MYKFANRENSFAVSFKFSAGKFAKQRISAIIWMPCFNKSFLTDAYLRRRFKTFTKNPLCKYACDVKNMEKHISVVTDYSKLSVKRSTF